MARNLASPTGRTFIGPEEHAYNVSLSSSPRRGKAICLDGKIRSVQLGVPDTYFSIPARCKINGKTITGLVSVASDVLWADDPAPEFKVYGGKRLVDNPNAGEFEFRPYTYRKNANAV